MYQEHFGLFTSPFSLSPHLQFLYKSASFEETTAHLVYGLKGGEDIVLITGEIGIGKTLALQNLVHHVSSTYDVALINVTAVDYRELLKLVLAELDVTVPAGSDRADLLSTLKERLLGLARDGRRLLLIVDEAQNLDSATLEGVRLLSNLSPHGQQALQIVLSGQPALREKIDLPELAQLRQRIRVHYHLEALSAVEVGDYVQHRLNVAGCDREIFETAAIRKVHELSGGVPRLVNILADKAMLSAYVDNSASVAAAHVETDQSVVRSPNRETEEAARAASSSEPLPTVEIVKEPDSADETVGIVDDPPAALVPDPGVLDGDRSPSLARLGWLIAVSALVIVASILWWLQPWGGDAGRVEEVGSPTARSESEAVAAPVDTPVADVDEDDLSIVDADTLATAESDTTVFAAATEPVPTDVEEDVPAEDEVTLIDENGAAEGESYLTPDLQGLCVHVGSFQGSLLADSFARDLSAVGLPVAVKAAVVDGTEWYRVYVGPYITFDEAQAAQARITEGGLTSWTMITRVR